ITSPDTVPLTADTTALDESTSTLAEMMWLPASGTVPLTCAPGRMTSVPPLLTVVPLAMPPLNTTSKPPPLTTVPLTAPSAETNCAPPLSTVVSSATPP